VRILVLADIHANWAALSAIDEPFDRCLVIGDVVEYGTNPVPCVDWVRDCATACVRGNHDHAVAQRVPPKGGHGFRGLAAATRPYHWQVLGDDRMRYLARLPVVQRVPIGDHVFHLVHATPRDPMDEYLGPDEEAWRARLTKVQADVVCVGHTHVPYVLDLGTVRVLNPGSVGQPRDGDPRASYAIVEDGRIELRRVEYDVEAAIRHLHTAGLTGPALELAETVLRTGSAPERRE
jgi:putative phosphoesterase